MNWLEFIFPKLFALIGIANFLFLVFVGLTSDIYGQVGHKVFQGMVEVIGEMESNSKEIGNYCSEKYLRNDWGGTVDNIKKFNPPYYYPSPFFEGDFRNFLRLFPSHFTIKNMKIIMMYPNVQFYPISGWRNITEKNIFLLSFLTFLLHHQANQKLYTTQYMYIPTPPHFDSYQKYNINLQPLWIYITRNNSFSKLRLKFLADRQTLSEWDRTSENLSNNIRKTANHNRNSKI